MKELKVSGIDFGTVIDHLPVESVFKIMEILNLPQIKGEILMGTNLYSNRSSKKGVLKFQGRFLTNTEIDKIALLAGGATINKIENFEVVRKDLINVPDHINSCIKCFNPNCITNFEDIHTKFKVVDKEDIKIKCIYCEKITEKKNIVYI